MAARRVRGTGNWTAGQVQENLDGYALSYPPGLSSRQHELALLLQTFDPLTGH